MKKPVQREGRTTGAQPGQQYAALPYREAEGLEVLLLTSRETRRWVIPKGWPMKGKRPHAAAAREALEEAGVTGRTAKRAMGSYSYVKRLKNGAPLQCVVEVFPLKVAGQRTHWREQAERTVRWFPVDQAAEAVDEPELQALIGALPNVLAQRRKKVSKATATKANGRSGDQVSMKARSSTKSPGLETEPSS